MTVEDGREEGRAGPAPTAGRPDPPPGAGSPEPAPTVGTQEPSPTAEPAEGSTPSPGTSQPRLQSGRQRARRRAVVRRRRRIALLAAGLVLLVIAALVGWYELQAHPGGPTGKQVVISVQQGEASGDVVADLAKEKVVTSGLAFRIFLFFHGTPTIRPGSYLMHENLSFASARQDLAQGPNVLAVDVPAGLTLGELAQRYADVTGTDANAFLATARSGAVTSPYEVPGSNNLEGLVAPGTYYILPGETDRQVLQKMVSHFDQVAAAAGATPAAATALGLTPNQLVTVASIVEKEGVYPVNLGGVSRVIYNRLAAGMPLQMDSTVLYSLGRDGGAVTEQDLRTDTPYNTYLHSGLTPTPIAFPSPGALSAAAHPPAASWLYFVVVTKSGVEAFSSTYAGQLANEALARQRGLG